MWFFCCTMDSEYTGKTNRMCRFVCLRKSYCSHGLSVMRWDMGTINSFCLDDGVRKILLMWGCHLIDERYLMHLCISATNPMKILSWVLRSHWGYVLINRNLKWSYWSFQARPDCFNEKRNIFKYFSLIFQEENHNILLLLRISLDSNPINPGIPYLLGFVI